MIHLLLKAGATFSITTKYFCLFTVGVQRNALSASSTVLRSAVRLVATVRSGNTDCVFDVFDAVI